MRAGTSATARPSSPPAGFPRTDPYSFTKAGQPWFAWEWAADVAAGAVHRAAGLRGVALFYGLAIAAGVWMWFRLHWAMGGNFLLACGMAPLLLSTCNIHWLARPHVLGWLFLLGMVWWCERGGGAWGAALIAAAWANVHGSFLLARGGGGGVLGRRRRDRKGGTSYLAAVLAWPPWPIRTAGGFTSTSSGI